jgi:cbb3-type cytochrome oxidase subunit 3
MQFIQVIAILTLIITIGLIFYIYKQNKKEHFQNNQVNTLPQNNLDEKEKALMQISPESTYKFKNYFLEKEPVDAQVVKNQIVHIFPEGVLENDVILSTQKKIRFSENENGEIVDKYVFGPSDEDNNRHFKLFLKDDPNKNNAFQIWGGACTAQSDCNKSGVKLHNFTDRPSYVMKDITGNTIHELTNNGTSKHINKIQIGNMSDPSHILLGNNGNQYSKGVINSKDINVRNRLFFSQAEIDDDPNDLYKDGGKMHDTDPMFIEKIRHSPNNNSLRVNIKNNKSDKFEVYGSSWEYNRSRNPVRLMEVNGHGNVWAKNTVNAQDVNVRGRIYFSQAENDDIINPEDPNFDFRKWQSMHNTDPYYIEKVNRGPNKSALKIVMKDDGIRNDNSIREALEIWTDSCAYNDERTPRRNRSGCASNSGRKIMEIRSDGTVNINGRLNITGNLFVNGRPK